MKIDAGGEKTVIFFLLAFLLWGAFTLGFHPPVEYGGDEFWRLEIARNFAETGEFHRSILTPRLYFSALSLFVLLSGGADVFAGRLLSLLMGALAVYLTYRIALKASGSEKTALGASVLLGTNFVFLWHSKTVSTETMTSALIAGSFLAALHAAKSGKAWIALSGGLLLSLSVNVHPNNLQYVVSLSMFFLFLNRKRLPSAATAAFLGGALAGFFVWYFGVYMSTKGVGASAVSGVVKSYPFPILNRNIFSLLRESALNFPRDYVLNYLRLADGFYPGIIGLAAFAAVSIALWGAALFTRMRGVVLAFAGFSSATLFINYFLAKKFGYWHMVELFPFFAVSTAASIMGIAEKLKGRLGKAFPLVLLAAFAASGVLNEGASAWKAKDYDYGGLIQKVGSGVPREGRVLGSNLYRPALKGRLVNYFFLNIDRPFASCPPFGEMVESLGVKYIIMDERLSTIARGSCGPIYEKQLIRYLNLKCRPIAKINASYPNHWAPAHMIKDIMVFGVEAPSGGSTQTP